MIAVSLPRKRIAFTPGLKDAKKKELVIQMWVKNDWLGYYCMPNLLQFSKGILTGTEAVPDVIYFGGK